MDKPRPLTLPIKKTGNKLHVSFLRVPAWGFINDGESAPLRRGALGRQLVAVSRRVAIGVPGGNQVGDILLSKGGIARSH